VRRTHLAEFRALVAGAGFEVQTEQVLPGGDAMVLLERKSDPIPNP
jgi:hypothetical protein